MLAERGTGPWHKTGPSPNKFYWLIRVGTKISFIKQVLPNFLLSSALLQLGFWPPSNCFWILLEVWGLMAPSCRMFVGLTTTRV